MKANGDGTLPGRPYTVDDQPAPQDSCGASKRGAEQALQAPAAKTGVDVVIIRPVLVYDPGSGPAGALVAITDLAFEQLRATVWNSLWSTAGQHRETKALLEWAPAMIVDGALEKTAKGFLGR